ncbi:putative DNA helicase [Vibrio phage 424E50-1]|nr:putative DNA helicase [Vibrio phage 424E50-1]
MAGFSKRANKGNQTTTQREDYTPQLRPLPKVVNKIFKPTAEQEYAETLFMSKKYGIVKIGASAGSGKAQPIFCTVQTPRGEVSIGSLSVGDAIFSVDGTITKVTGVYPQGKKDTYKITFRDETFTYCCGEHLWEVSKATWKVPSKVLKTKDILSDKIISNQGNMQFKIPLCSPVQYPPKDYFLAPYLLGALLGDGALAGNSIRYSYHKNDTFIVDKLSTLLPSNYIVGAIKETSTNGLQVGINCEDSTNQNHMLIALRNLGLDVKSGERFIPKNYLMGSENQRWELLRGLMDSDGSCTKNRTSFSTTSYQMKEDICTLVQSLGGTAIPRTYYRHDKSYGEEYHINIKVFENPFSLPRKAEEWSPSKKNPPSRYIKSIEKLDLEVEQVCISVDHPRKLYLTDNFIVTHNTTTLYHLGKQDTRPSLGLVFGKDMAEEARAKSPSHIDWRSTHSLAYGKFGAKYQHKLKRPQGRYVNVAGTGAEIGRYLGLKPMMPFFGGHINIAYLGLIIKETVGKFETSAEEVLSRKHIPYSHIKDIEKKNGRMFNKDKFKLFIRDHARELWELRKNLSSNVLITHNTYLKLYHLSDPDLSLEYSVLYIDESQDLNPVTLDIVMKQQGKCKIVLVGDHFQSIFQFNGAVNAMETIKGEEASLTKSFRFGQPIADLASAILDYKLNIRGNENIESMISDKNVIDEDKPYTILFRGNMELIFTAVQFISEGKDVQVYVDLREFVKTITSAKELRAGNLKGVKAEKIIPFEDWNELVEEGKTDPELSRLVKIIDGEDADRIVKQLKDHKNNNDAHITMLSAHKSKGLEWEQVILANDFVSNYNKKGEWVGLSDQERNLLYVAATRAERRLQYNTTVGEILDHHNMQRDLNNTSEFDKLLGTEVIGNPQGGVEYEDHVVENLCEPCVDVDLHTKHFKNSVLSEIFK